MIRDKKGAMELSMTTIIIIVIGVTLLSLGIIWVKNTMDRVTGLSEGAFENAERELGSGDFEGTINAPRRISLKSGEKKIIIVQVKNMGEDLDADSLKYIMDNPSSEEACLDVSVLGSSERNIKKGAVGEFSLGVGAKSTCLSGSYYVNADIKPQVSGVDPKQYIFVVEVK